MPRGGKIAALGSSSYSSGPSTSREAHSTEVTSTVASMLQELQSLIKQTQVGGEEWALNRVIVLTSYLLTQEERENGEQTLVGIRKTHEKMKNELRGMVPNKYILTPRCKELVLPSQTLTLGSLVDFPLL